MTSYICEPVQRTVLEERASARPGQHARHRWPHKVRAGLAWVPVQQEEGQVENDLASKLKLSAGGSLF